MKLAESRRRITELFSADSRGETLQLRAWQELLEPWLRAGVGALVGAPESVCKFLYYGCARFDRWSGLTPYVLDPNETETFNLFLDALTTAERTASQNLSTLRVHQLRSELYDSCALQSSEGTPLAVGDTNAVVTSLRTRLSALAVPTIATNKPAFESAARDLTALCDGAEQDDVTLKVEGQLPHPVAYAHVSGTGLWHEVPFEFELQPAFSGASGLKATGGFIAPAGTTRWPSGTCHVSLTIHALVDHAACAPPLFRSNNPATPFLGSPLSHRLTYECLADVLGVLCERNPDWMDPFYVLVPRDLDRFKILTVAAGVEVTSILLQGVDGVRFTVGDIPTVSCELGSVAPESYVHLGLRQARGYLSLGATREAMVWANMAVESLLDERIAEAIAADAGWEARLTASALLYAKAEAVVVGQRPDLAGYFNWPTSETRPNRYAEIKGLHRHAPMASDAKDGSS